jgi:hypothetical protein
MYRFPRVLRDARMPGQSTTAVMVTGRPALRGVSACFALVGGICCSFALSGSVPL